MKKNKYSGTMIINVANFTSFWPRPWTKEGQRMRKRRKEGGLFLEQEEYQQHLTYMMSIKVFATCRYTAARSVPGGLISQSCFCFSVSLNLQQNKPLSGPLAPPYTTHPASHGHCYHSHKGQTERKQTDERTEDGRVTRNYMTYKIQISC